MIVFAFLASVVLLLAYILNRVPQSLHRQSIGWPLYSGILTFIPIIGFKALVFPNLYRYFLFWPQVLDSWLRDLLFPLALIFLVALFVPIFGRKRLQVTQAPLFFTVAWSLTSLELIVSNIQHLDSLNLFIRPALFALSGLGLLCTLHLLIQNRKRWVLLVPLAVLMSFLNVLATLSWQFHDYFIFTITSLVILLIALAVLLVPIDRLCRFLGFRFSTETSPDNKCTEISDEQASP